MLIVYKVYAFQRQCLPFVHLNYWLVDTNIICAAIMWPREIKIWRLRHRWRTITVSKLPMILVDLVARRRITFLIIGRPPHDFDHLLWNDILDSLLIKFVRSITFIALMFQILLLSWQHIGPWWSARGNLSRIIFRLFALICITILNLTSFIA